MKMVDEHGKSPTCNSDSNVLRFDEAPSCQMQNQNVYVKA